MVTIPGAETLSMLQVVPASKCDVQCVLAAWLNSNIVSTSRARPLVIRGINCQTLRSLLDSMVPKFAAYQNASTFDMPQVGKRQVSGVYNVVRVPRYICILRKHMLCKRAKPGSMQRSAATQPRALTFFFFFFPPSASGFLPCW